MPEAPSSEMLFTSIKEKSRVDVNKKPQQNNQVHTKETQRIRNWWQQLLPLLNDVAEPELQEWISLAFLGACVGYSERNLLPHHPAHQYLYPQIIDEISQVYAQLQAEGHQFNLEDIRYEIYDYGIKCVYHLDWKLYMSQEFY